MSASDTTAHRARWPSARAAVRTVSVEQWAILALAALAAVIRIVLIDNQSFWTDEALTAYEAQLPFGAMLHTVLHVETTPPLYFVLIWFWAKLFGNAEIALRSVSAIAGVALVPIAYSSARELVSRRAGLLAAAFVAVNPFMLWYSQEARSYMLVAALTGASFMWFARALRDPSRQNLAWWAAWSSAAVMTHYFAGFVIFPEALWLLWAQRSRTCAIAVAVVGLAQAAMLPFAVIDSNAAHGTAWIAHIAPLTRIAVTVVEWGGSNLYRRTTVFGGLLVGAVLISIVLALLLLAGDRRTRAGAKVAGVIAAFAFGSPLVLGAIGYDYFLSRNLIPAFLPVVVVLAAACAAPRARALGAALAAALLAVFVLATIDVQTHPYLQRADWRGVARSLGPAAAPRAVLAADGTTADPLKIYLPGVAWVQPRGRPTLISEIDVVGATKRLRLQGPGIGQVGVERVGAPSTGRPLPRSVAPPGSTLLTRYRVANWVVARFELARPMRLSLDQLASLAPRYFRHTPSALLIFTQHRAR
jgi:4-amino-4-deoxy-L-arabinose transferase-like glycosyltransferase